MSIIMAGGIYCPLSARDPAHRLQQLIEQTKTRLVLVHSATAQYLKNGQGMVNIDTMLNTDEDSANRCFNLLSKVTVTPESIAYIIFTSGSTGTPKVVCIRCLPFPSHAQKKTLKLCFNGFY